MHLPSSARRSFRRLSRVALAAATAALLVAPTPAAAADLSLYYAPSTSNGWFPRDSVTVQLLADVSGIVTNPDDGQYDEILLKVECSGEGVSGGMSDEYGVRTVDTVIYVTIDGPTSITGSSYLCVATYQRQYYYDCHFVFGHYCNVVIPFEDNEFTRLYSGRVYLDGTAPTEVTGTPESQPNAAGWYRTPGKVDFSGRDSQSGIRSCSQDVPFGGTSAPFGLFVTGTCTNGAGIEGRAGFNYKYDDVAPSLAPTVTPAIVPLNGSATASANATDRDSKVKTQQCDPVDTSVPGTHTVTCRATDNADNSASAEATYTVGYSFSGFAQPVDATAINIAKAGRSIPLKWRLTDAAGAPVNDLAHVTVTATSLSCASGTTEDLIEEYATGGSGLQNLGDGSYQFNWSTPKSYAGSCKTLTLDLGDGIVHTASFEFSK